jgi:hypothetical protein
MAHKFPVQRVRAYRISVHDVFALMLDFSEDSRGKIDFSFLVFLSFVICSPDYEPLRHLNASYAIRTVPFQEFASESVFAEAFRDYLSESFDSY